MCTSIVEIVAAEGMAQRGDRWFTLARAAVTYDHARHAMLEEVITLDFVDGGSARTGVELSLDSAKALRAALDRAIAAADHEEAEVRGKGAPMAVAKAA